MRLVDLDTTVTTWHYDFDKQEYVAVQTTVGEMIDLDTLEGLSVPIIEIKEPHGRLIDADEFFEALTMDNRVSIVEAMHVQSILSDAPTIIPASVEDET